VVFPDGIASKQGRSEGRSDRAVPFPQLAPMGPQPPAPNLRADHTGSAAEGASLLSRARAKLRVNSKE